MVVWGTFKAFPLPVGAPLLPTGGREKRYPLDVIAKILTPDLCSSSAAPRGHVVTEDLFDANARPRSTAPPVFWLHRQRLVPKAVFLPMGVEVLGVEPGVGLLRAIS